MLWFLSDTDQSELEWRLQDLENAKGNSKASMTVNVWDPFEYKTVNELLELINDLEEQFNDCQEPLLKNIDVVKEILSYDDRDEDEKIRQIDKLLNNK